MRPISVLALMIGIFGGPCFVLGQSIPDVESLVLRLSASRTEALELAPFADRIPEWSVADAYRIQHAVDDAQLDRQESIAGFKIAFTTKQSMKRWNLTRPAYGSLYQSGRPDDPSAINAADYCRFHIEPEIAFTLAKPIPAAPATMAELVGCVRSVHLAMEMPDLRFDVSDGWPNGRDLIADALGSHGWVIGKGIPTDHFDPATEVQFLRNGTVHSQGSAGTASPGNPATDPWIALRGLAELRIQHGHPLESGQVILTGPRSKAYFPDSNEQAPGVYEVQADGFETLCVTVR